MNFRRLTVVVFALLAMLFVGQQAAFAQAPPEPAASPASSPIRRVPRSRARKSRSRTRTQVSVLT